VSIGGTAEVQEIQFDVHLLQDYYRVRNGDISLGHTRNVHGSIVHHEPVHFLSPYNAEYYHVLQS
jgi:hypothetical protein